MIILLIEDDNGIAELIREKLENELIHIIHVENFVEADQIIAQNNIFLMIVDYSLTDDYTADKWIETRKKEKQHIPPFIVSTGQGDEYIAVKMMKLGARDYLIKDSLLLDKISVVVTRLTIEIENEQKLKTAENKVSEISEFYKNIIENAADGIVLLDSLFKFTYISPASYKIFGYQPHEIDKLTQEPILHPDDEQYVITEVNKSLNDATYSPTLEHRIKHRDGHWIWVESQFTNLLQNLAVGALVVNFKNIQDRKSAYEKLKKNRDTLNILLHETAELITSENKQPDYQKITNTVLSISEAQFAVFNIFDTKKNTYVTKAFCGLENRKEVSKKLLGFDLVGQKWNRPLILSNPSIGTISIYKSFSEISGNTIPSFALKLIESSFRIKTIVIVTIYDKLEILGHFILLYNTEIVPQHPEILELYGSLVGQYLVRKQSENDLKEKMEELIRFQKVTVGREINMIELKKEINELLKVAGNEERYKIV